MKTCWNHGSNEYTHTGYVKSRNTKVYKNITIFHLRTDIFYSHTNHSILQRHVNIIVLYFSTFRAMLEEEEKWMSRQSEALSEKRAIQLISEELYLDVIPFAFLSYYY